MEEDRADLDHSLRLDGNAAAGLLQEVFALEMTACPVECAHCGREGELATLAAYGYTAGVVLRCPVSMSQWHRCRLLTQSRKLRA